MRLPSVLAAAGLTILLLSGTAAAGLGTPTKAAAPRAERYVWRNVKIVAGGFVDGIIFHPKQRGLAYLRTDMGGAYRWDATARRWTPLTDWAGFDDWNMLGIESLAVDRTDPQRVYIAAGTYTNSWAGNGAILRSRDQGRTWQRTNMPFKFGGNEDGRSIGERLAVDPNQPAIIYLGTRHNGLWRSADRGVTWKQAAGFPITGRTNGIGIGFVVFDSRSGRPSRPTSTIYAGADVLGTTLYRSADAGATWQAVAGQPNGLLPHHAALDAAGTLYVTYGNAPGPNGMSDGAVWKLNTKTGAWTDITPLRPGAEGAGRFGYAGLAIDPRRRGVVVVTTMDRWNPGDDIFRTTDGGKTWKALGAQSRRDCSASPYLKWGQPAPKLGWWMGCIAIDPFDPDHALYVTGATIWGTHDLTDADRNKPTHWAVEAEGVEQTAVLDLVSPPVGPHLLSGLADLGGFRHDDLNVSPRQGMFGNPVFGSGTSVDFAELKPNIVVRVGQAGGGAKRGAVSTDGGATWTPFASEPAGTRGGGTVAISAEGSTVVWAPDRMTPARSTDPGGTWQPCAGLPAGVCVFSDRTAPSRFYALDSRAGKLYVSADRGATFAAGATVPAGKANGRAVPSHAGDLWLAVEKAGLYHVTGSDPAATRASSVQDAYAIGFGKAAPGRKYPALYLAGQVGGVKGIFRSDDEARTWARINDNAHQYGWIGIVTGDPRVYGRVYIGANGRGILYGEPATASAMAMKLRAPRSP